MPTLYSHPSLPQQLFVLIAPSNSHPHHHAHTAILNTLGQALATQFAQGLVIGTSISVASTTDTHHQPTVHDAVLHWQQHSGLTAASTALIALDAAATHALSAWAAQPAFCARLFAVYGDGSTPTLPKPPQPPLPTTMHDDTCIYCLCGTQPTAAMAVLHHTIQDWQALNTPDGLALDMTLDVLPALHYAQYTDNVTAHDAHHTATAKQTTASKELSLSAACQSTQQRILWLLQNHVPQKLWRAALATARQQE